MFATLLQTRFYDTSQNITVLKKPSPHIIMRSNAAGELPANGRNGALEIGKCFNRIEYYRLMVITSFAKRSCVSQFRYMNGCAALRSEWEPADGNTTDGSPTGHHHTDENGSGARPRHAPRYTPPEFPQASTPQRRAAHHPPRSVPRDVSARSSNSGNTPRSDLGPCNTPGWTDVCGGLEVYRVAV